MIRVESHNFKPLILILDQNKQLLNKGSSDIQIKIPRAGIYTVVVTSQNPKTTGQYDIEIIYLTSAFFQ